jgi:hypothetical protein
MTRVVVLITYENGYDSYGYSCFDSENNLVGFGEGVDIEGFTESDYLSLNDLSSYERATYYDKGYHEI